jgi:Zn-dependent protease with chaperone function
MAEEGRLKRGDFVRMGSDGDWVGAIRVKGLFELPPNLPSAPAANLAERFRNVTSVADCLSREERKKRFGSMLLNCCVWCFLGLMVVTSWGLLLVLYGSVWAANWLLSEYNVRRLLAFGTAAEGGQFPEIEAALSAVCEKFGVTDIPKVIVLNQSSINALAVKFAQKKVIVLFSQTLEGILDRPAELRFLLAHELAHIVLDHGPRGTFEIYKTASYKQARELTCDNCGLAAAGDLESAKTMLKRLGVGNELHPRLDERFLIAEAEYIYSGLTGWFIKQYLTHPPLGKRIANVQDFSQTA